MHFGWQPLSATHSLDGCGWWLSYVLALVRLLLFSFPVCLSSSLFTFLLSGTIFSIYDYGFFAAFATRYVLELATAFLCVVHIFKKPAEEAAPLLSSSANGAAYGSIQGNAETSRKSEPSAFSNFFGKMRKLLPHIWPHKSVKLQLLVLACFGLMLLGLAVNAMTPLQIGKVVDGLGEGKGKYTTIMFARMLITHYLICLGRFAWAAVLTYVGLRFLQGGVCKI